ncbi:hypothetical protein PVK06_023646 [Gossypium arboreum]|uniref:Uncharacterized protein n=1 Tax=Gossypium arboreum TaxID=29729 RepID=A0ABR0PBV8_GOSAR|nr:hypothetical protein PVK06_023646 [Gossypium arboreum]
MPDSDDSPPSLTAALTTDSQSPSFFYIKHVNARLDEKDYLLWKQQDLFTVRGHSLEHFFDNSTTPPPKISVIATGESILNETYTQFVKQDCALASWLLSTISPNILPQLIGAKTSTSIWSTLTRLFLTLSITKVMHLYCKLCSLGKGALSMRDYLFQIKEVHEPYTLDRVTTILMNVESCHHDPHCLPLSINTAQVMTPTPIDFVSTLRPWPNTSGPSTYSFPFPSQAQFSRHVHTSHLVPRPHFSYNNRGRGKITSRLQCQLCGRMGHLSVFLSL